VEQTSTRRILSVKAHNPNVLNRAKRGAMRHHFWIATATFTGAAIALLSSCNSPKSRLDNKAVLANEDEVYEAVVRDIFTPTHGHSNITQLVFDENVLNYLDPGTEINTCEESVRKRLLLEDSTPPFNTLADRLYRVLTRSGNDATPRGSTIQDSIEKSCTKGPLSRTFRTDIPRVFINTDSVSFGIVSTHKKHPKDFHETFPGATGVVSLSRVGLDPTLQEAIVSTSFVFGFLCGTDWRYILKKETHG
jgi:hypothetical protein